jgi:hypothetical protein
MTPVTSNWPWISPGTQLEFPFQRYSRDCGALPYEDIVRIQKELAS